MKREICAALGVVSLFVVFFLAIMWIGQGNDFFLYKVFAPKYEQVRHDTFKESQAYNDGMKNDLQDLWIQYTGANTTPEQRDALASTILHRFASYDDSRLPSDLGNFLRQVRRERTSSR